MADTLVWREGWPEWRPAREAIARVRQERPSAPPPPPRFPPGRADGRGAAEKAVTAAHHSVVGMLATFGPLAGAIATLADFLKPVVELTRPIAILGLVLAGLLWMAARVAPALREGLIKGSVFCLLMALCSAAWWGLQAAMPQSASGALVEIVPGAGALQESLVSSMQRVEQQTKRVGDLLEQQAQEEREQEEEARRQMAAYEREQLDGARKAITEAGLTVDADGFAKSIAQGVGRQGEFDTLKIALTAEALAGALRRAANVNEIQNLTYFIQGSRDGSAMLRGMEQTLYEDGARLRKAFMEKNARKVLCDPRTVKLVVGESTLATLCTLDDRMFAIKYASFFGNAYARIGGSRSAEQQYYMLNPLDYLKNDLGSLRVIKVPGKLSLKTLEACKYYEGVYSFFFSAGLSPYGAKEDPGSSSLTFFDASDFAFNNYPIHIECPFNDVMLGDKPQCKARVIVASHCEGASTAVVKAQKLP